MTSKRGSGPYARSPPPFYRKGKFSLLNPSKAEHLIFGVGRGPRATLTGQRAMCGPKAEGLPTLAGPSEVVSAARHSLTHEAGFKVINDMINDLGLDGAADFLRTTVTRRKGGVTTEVPVLQDLFGEKVGRYAGDRLGLNAKVSGKEHGLWETYYANGQVEERITYEKGVRQGLWERYNENGALLAKGTYIRGKKSGRWERYYANGQLMLWDTWKRGKTNGPMARYDRDG